MAIKRYKGVVKTAFPNHAFIDLSSVVMFDGSPHDLETKHDIFVHKGEFDVGGFKVGMELTFEVCEDIRNRKAGALRAEAVVFSGVEIQFPETVVDHPVVPVTWCFKPSVLEYIKAHQEKTFSLVIGTVLLDPNRRVRGFEHNIGPDVLKDGRSYISFYAPGEYEVYAYLVEYDNDERTVKKAMTNLSDVHCYDAKSSEGQLYVYGSANLRFLHNRNVDGRVLAISELSVSVPDGIFAKPMTGLSKAWFCYFWDEDLIDDCDRRPKQWFAFTLGIPMFFLWELFWRTFFFFWGLLAFVVGIKPAFAWKETFCKQLSSDYDSVMYGRKEDLMDYDDWKTIFRPWVLLVWAVAVWCFFYFDEFRDAVIKIFIAITVALIGLAVYLVWQRFFKKSEEEKRVKEMLRNEKVWHQFENAVQCGAQASKKPISVRLIFAGVKRAVCRNYRKV